MRHILAKLDNDFYRDMDCEGFASSLEDKLEKKMTEAVLRQQNGLKRKRILK
jgi:hypothetical protein